LKDIPADVFHEVIREQLSVAEYVQIILQRLSTDKRVAFRDFFSQQPKRQELVVTFLAALELVKMRMLKVEQANEFGEIWLSLAVSALESESPPVPEGDSYEYE
jgi:segregation and condensation protein A